MPNMKPDREVKHGWHQDSFYPGFIRSVWTRGPIHLTRERKYEDRTNSKLKTEAWILSFPGQTKRVGIKLERDV